MLIQIKCCQLEMQANSIIYNFHCISNFKYSTDFPWILRNMTQMPWAAPATYNLEQFWHFKRISFISNSIRL